MKKHKRNKKNFGCYFLCLVLLAAFVVLSVDFIRFPECYLPKWRYQLQNDIKAGDAEAIEYYKNTYISNGRNLYTE